MISSCWRCRRERKVQGLTVKRQKFTSRRCPRYLLLLAFMREMVILVTPGKTRQFDPSLKTDTCQCDVFTNTQEVGNYQSKVHKWCDVMLRRYETFIITLLFSSCRIEVTNPFLINTQSCFPVGSKNVRKYLRVGLGNRPFPHDCFAF